jgi:hypothetical protein
VLELCSELEDCLYPDAVALEAVLGVEFRQPLHLNGEGVFPNREDVVEHWSHACSHALKPTQLRPGAAVACDLLVIEGVRADADEPFPERQELRDAASA